ncbi:MAG TPA: hypothetical protein VEJ40_07610 [Pseudolabrys sp.]|nr:hypothetical protein [Pseudolabrys sp.]
MKFRTIAYVAVIAAGAFALASATPGLAKGKKKAAAAPMSHPEVCLNTYEPVCGSLKGQKFTYANACSAEKDGAKVVSSKACSEKMARKKSKKMKM